MQGDSCLPLQCTGRKQSWWRQCLLCLSATHSSGSCSGLWPLRILAAEQAGCARTSLCTSQKVTVEVPQQETIRIFYRAQILLPASLLLILTRHFSWQRSNTSHGHVHFDTASKRHSIGLYLSQIKKDLHNQILDDMIITVLNYTIVYKIPNVPRSNIFQH